MLFSAITTLVLSLSSVASATSPSSSDASNVVQVHQRRYNHRQLSRSLSSPSSGRAQVAPAVVPLRRRSTKKRNSCSANSSGNNSTSSANSSGNNSTSSDTGSGNNSTSSDTGSGDNSSSGDSGSSSNSTATTTTSDSSKHHTTTQSSGSQPTGGSSTPSGGKSGGLLRVTDPKCGSNNPSATVTESSGPNGAESWFNCGLTSGGGWTPPMVKLEEIVYVDLETAISNGNTFDACKPHVDLFNQYGKQYNIPPIMLAAFAMQESGCSQDVNNSAGTIGMFQLAPENCRHYQTDCEQLDGNIEAACKLIIDYMSAANGNVVAMVGGYNGWSDGMTASQAKSHPCNQQQNLDYLQQFFNAWLQGKNGYSVGTIKNCSGNFGRKRSLFVPRFARNDEVPRLGWSF